MVDAALAGSRSDGLERLRVTVVSALEVTSADVLGAAGYLLATPANLGYMSGALKHAFDTTYNDALKVTQRRPTGCSSMANRYRGSVARHPEDRHRPRLASRGRTGFGDRLGGGPIGRLPRSSVPCLPHHARLLIERPVEIRPEVLRALTADTEANRPGGTVSEYRLRRSIRDSTPPRLVACRITRSDAQCDRPSQRRRHRS